MPLQITSEWRSSVHPDQIAELDPIVARINAKLGQIDESSSFESRAGVFETWMAPLRGLGLDFRKTGAAFWFDIKKMNKDLQGGEEEFLRECNVLNEVWGWDTTTGHTSFERITHFGMGSNQSWTDPIMRFLFYHKEDISPFIDDFDQKQPLSLSTIGMLWDKSTANQLTMGLALWSVYFENLGPENLQLIKRIFEYEFDNDSTSLPMALFVYQVRAWIFMCLYNSKGSRDQFVRMSFLISSYKELPDVNESYSLFEYVADKSSAAGSSSAESSAVGSSVGASLADSGRTATPPPLTGDDAWFYDDSDVKYESPTDMSTPERPESLYESRETESTGWVKRQPRPSGSYSTRVV